MDKLVLRVLDCLFGNNPSFVELEKCRQEAAVGTEDFRRVAAYLTEKRFLEMADESHRGAEGGGVYGQVRITAAGIDWLNSRSRTVRAKLL